MQTRRVVRSLLLCAAGALAAVTSAGRAEEGMWLLNKPPVDLLREKHGFTPTAEWLERLQKSAVKMGASGSFVSPRGLIMTNHHVASDALAKLSTPERDLLVTGFHARTPGEELRVPAMEVSVLMSIEDVTDRVNAAAQAGMSSAEANAARRKAMTAIEAESQEKTGLLSQVVTLYQGGMYHLHRYKKFDDVRLVFAPESQIGFFGGDTDNFEYPRYCLDVAFLRAYENGKPFEPEHYLPWSAAGAQEGELTFVVGHPGRTRRLFTVDHLRFLRDTAFPVSLQRLWRREVQLQTFMARSAENERIAKDDLFGVANSRKVSTGRLAGLHDPAVMGRKMEAEQRLRSSVEQNAEWRAKWGDAWETLRGAQDAHRQFFRRLNALQGVGGGSDLFGIALTLVRLAEEQPKPNAERLREYRDTALPSVFTNLYSEAPIHPALEVNRLHSGMSALAEMIGGEDPTTLRVFGDRSPRVRAEEMVLGTKLGDIAERRRLAEGGKAAIESSTDPLIVLVRSIDPELRELRKRFEDTVEAPERDAYAKIAAALFATYGESMYPDATGTLRLTFGTVQGYEEAGARIPAFTDFAGLYERAALRAGQKEFVLPERWVERKGRLDLRTPFNFVSTADIIGGNSGSPQVNARGEVVGLIFDGNLHSLATDIAYDEVRSRALSVDSRAIIEALRKVYDANELADEITGSSR